MSEEEITSVLTHPLVMVASDGGAAAVTGPLSETTPHPRFYGTFPRVLGKYSREEGLFDLPTAVHKMTGQPALRLGLADRGRIDVGLVADLVVFDPDTVIDRADFINPHQYAQGIERGTHWRAAGQGITEAGGIRLSTCGGIRLSTCDGDARPPIFRWR